MRHASRPLAFLLCASATSAALLGELNCAQLLGLDDQLAGDDAASRDAIYVRRATVRRRGGIRRRGDGRATKLFDH